MKTTPSKSKKITRQGILGQRGVNLIEKMVLEMGSRWTPSGPNEVGIDGYIELFDPINHAPLGKTVAVQSKALSSFENETDESFDYWCKQKDIDYWLQGNVPVILVISNPELNEAYWVSIQNYFGGSERRSATKIHFIKNRQRFSPQSFDELFKLSRSPEIGFYLAPLPRTERLYSNLLPLKKLPRHIWVAFTTCRKPKDVWAQLEETKHDVDGAWILRDKTIISFNNLGEPPWSSICDGGTVERFECGEWSESEDTDRCRQFVELLNRTLSSQLYPDVRYWPNEDCYAYAGSIEQGSKRVTYKSAKRKSKITVVRLYKKTNPDGRIFLWLRHLAFRGQFRRFDGQWYLEITPTYRFTFDGYTLDRFHEDRLKGIKRIEGNRAVLSAVLSWCYHLSARSNLLYKKAGPLIFGNPLTFDFEVGIADEQWSSHAHETLSKKEIELEETYLPFLKDYFEE